MSGEDMIALAEKCEANVLHNVRYALNPPMGYGGQAAGSRAAALQWAQLSDWFRARASQEPHP